MQGQMLFVFFVNLDKQDKLPAIVERLSREMPLELVRFPMPSSDELVLTLADFMMDRGFSFSRESIDYLKTIMPSFMSIKHFDGFQTLENLADEIIYSYCSKEEVSCPYIAKADLLFIEQPNGYLERIGNSQMRTTNHRRIGFDARRDKQ
ncbi:MAG: hypothetical protein E7335_10945 [Clostridiales bacterium]|nr:hypothetical protein [Clostridiales bacterium]